jgi:mannose-6-phosphate isomerase-like protein (cupin superfamily)
MSPDADGLTIPPVEIICLMSTETSTFTKANLRRDVDDAAPKFGMPAEMHARFARSAIAGETLGLSLFSLEPNFRIPFGHKHESQEEVYVVVRGSGRIKVGDEVVELAEWDAIRIPKNTMRDVEAGPDGIEYLAFGAGEDPNEVEMSQGWWSN